MKFLKIFLISVISVILLAAAAVFIIITYYKKELSVLITDTLKKDYGITLQVQDVSVSLLNNWPHGSMQFKNVLIESDRFRDSKVKVGALSLSFNMQRMLHQEFVVKYIGLKDAEILFVKPVDTAVVKPVAQPDTTKKKQVRFEVSKISLRNTKLTYSHPARGQNIELIMVDDVITLRDFSDGLSAHIKGKVIVSKLIINPGRGEFLKHARAEVDLDCDYFKETKSICVKPGSSVEIDRQDYNVCSVINLGEKRRIALMIDTKRLEYHKVMPIVIPKIRRVLSNFDLQRAVDANILIVANPGKREDPIFIIKVTGENNDLTIGDSKIPYSDLAFKCRIVCIDSSMQRGNLSQARIIFDSVKGKLYEFPFSARVAVTNLTDPYLRVKGNIFIEASKLKSRLKDEFILKGNANAFVNYHGPTSKLNKREFLDPGMHLIADIHLKNVSYRLKTSPYEYTINGAATLNNHDLLFEKLLVKGEVGEARVKGKVEDFMSYLLGEKNGFKTTLVAATDLLDLNALLRRGNPRASNVPEPDNEEEEDEATIRKTSSVKKAMKKASNSSFEFNVNLTARKMLLRKITGEDMKVVMNYKNDVVDIRSLQVNTCDGKVTAKGTVRGLSRIKADISVENVDVNKAFTQFENFGQKVVVSENLKGKLSVEAKIKTQLDDKMEVIGQTFSGEVHVSLKDGHLINFEPIQNLSTFLFKNRDFNDVTFSEINESFRIHGFEMQINELEIGSNILNLYVVNGIYNLKGNSNINVLVPWSNLKKRGKNYIPRNTGESAENTKGLKINFSGPSNKMKITLGHKEQTALRTSI